MSFLRQIQEAAVDKDTDVPMLLRKCKVLATRLKNEPFKRWVDQELNGYKAKDDLPPYRVFTVNSFGYFSGYGGSGYKNAPIPLVSFPEKVRTNLRHSYLLSSVSYYFSLLNGNHDLQEPWPADLVAHFSSKILEDMNLMAAWKSIPRSAVVAMIDTVRNKILNFVLELEEEIPNAGELQLNSQTIPQEKVTQIFNTYISGNIQNVAAASTNFSQTSQISIIANDLESLTKYLEAQGIGPSDLLALKKAVEKDQTAEHRKPFGTKVTQWMAKMLSKAATGTWDVSTDVASSILTEALKQYFNL